MSAWRNTRRATRVARCETGSRACFSRWIRAPWGDFTDLRERYSGAAAMQMLAGTSGYSYKEWLGSFYPEKLPAGEMLRYYAGRFATVEINNTFYRMPAEAMLARWAEEVPGSFAF